MIRPAEFGSVHEDWTDRVKNECCPSKSKPEAAHPPPQKPSTAQGEQWRDQRTGEIDPLCCERPEQHGHAQNQIIKRRGGMRRCSDWIIFEIVMPNDRAGMFGAESDACHARITISVGEVNVPADHNVVIIGAPRREN